MTYVIFTPPLSQAMAAALGEALGRYALHVERLELWHIYQDGTRRLDQPLRETTMQIATSTSTGVGLGCFLAPLAAPLAPLLAALSLPHLLAWLLAVRRTVRKMHEANRRAGDPRAVAGEVRIALRNVSARRVGWLEYLLGAFCQLHGWTLTNPRQPAQARAGAAYARRRAALPPAWQESKR